MSWVSLEKAESGVLSRLGWESENLGSLNQLRLGQTDTAAGVSFRYHRAKTGVQPSSNAKKRRSDLAPSHQSWRDHGRQYRPGRWTGRSKSPVEYRCRESNLHCRYKVTLKVKKIEMATPYEKLTPGERQTTTTHRQFLALTQDLAQRPWNLLESTGEWFLTLSKLLERAGE